MMMILEYIANHPDAVIESLLTHLQISLIAMAISAVIALPIGILISRKKKLSGPVNAVCNVIFSIPSLALLAFLVPITGLGGTTAIIALTLYNQYILIKSTAMAFDEIPADIKEAGKAMGYTDFQFFREVELCLAAPTIISGFKLAFMGTIAGATLAATVGAGGLGEMILMGQTMFHWHKVFLGTILAALLGFLVSIIFQALEDRARRIAQGYGKRKS